MNSKKVKKTKLTSSTPAVKGSLAISAIESLSSSFEIGIPAKVKPLPKAKKPPMLEIICEAIKVVGVPRKGASYVSIRKWILNSSERAITDGRLIASLKRAFKIGLETEVLGRPPKSKDNHGLAGSFVLLKKNSPKTEKPKLKSAKGKSKTDNKTKKAKGKSESNAQAESPTRRLNLSDSLEVKVKGKKLKAKKELMSKPKVPSLKNSNARISMIAAKRSPKVAVQKTSKAKMPKVPAKKTATKLVGESKGPSKKTKMNKAKPVSKAKESSHSIEDELALLKAPKSKPQGKTVNAEVQSKGTKPKTLYSSRIKPSTTDLPRKDLSDTELEVKRLGRKSLKSYSSDTDINTIGSGQIDLKQVKKQKPKKIPKGIRM